jgi:hypothetical protein
MPRERDFLADWGTSLVKPQASLVGRDCVKRLFGRRVGWLTGEFDVKSRLKLHLRG